MNACDCQKGSPKLIDFRCFIVHPLSGSLADWFCGSGHNEAGALKELRWLNMVSEEIKRNQFGGRDDSR